MLELVCDLELPSGGDNWHRLRDGVLPEEFTQGMTPDLITSSDITLSLYIFWC